jgi:hypothetical protein
VAAGRTKDGAVCKTLKSHRCPPAVRPPKLPQAQPEPTLAWDGATTASKPSDRDQCTARNLRTTEIDETKGLDGKDAVTAEVAMLLKLAGARLAIGDYQKAMSYVQLAQDLCPPQVAADAILQAHQLMDSSIPGAA